MSDELKRGVCKSMPCNENSRSGFGAGSAAWKIYLRNVISMRLAIGCIICGPAFLHIIDSEQWSCITNLWLGL